MTRLGELWRAYPNSGSTDLVPGNGQDIRSHISPILGQRVALRLQLWLSGCSRLYGRYFPRNLRPIDL